MGHKIGYRARACIEVVNELVARESRKFSRHTIQMVCLIGIGLIKTLGTYLKSQVFHGLKDMVIALVYLYFKIADGVVAFLVVYIHQRADLREMGGDVLHE